MESPLSVELANQFFRKGRLDFFAQPSLAFMPGAIHGCESDRLRPLSEDQIKRMILNARRKNTR
jgi:hypothetical protein